MEQQRRSGGGYGGTRRAALSRRRGGGTQDSSSPPPTIAIRRRERTESSSGTEERETESTMMMGAPRDSTPPPPPSSDSQVKPTVILMKPQRSRKEVSDEEWPTVGGKPLKIIPAGGSSTSSSRTGTPVRVRRGGAGAGGESAAAAAVEESVTTTSSSSGYYYEKERGERSQQAFRRPPVIYGASSTAASSTAQSGAGQYQIIQQQKHQGVSEKGHSEIAPSNTAAAAAPLRGGIRLITEGMEISETPLDHLQDQSNFLVVGILGPQGVGKSTLLSMIGGNDPFDMYRQYIFRPASKECTETGGRQTAGVQFYVNEDRVILLDSQPILSQAVMEQMNQNDRRYHYDYRMAENCMEVESLQIASFMMQVCHVVIFMVDWFVDVNLLRFIQTAEMLKPSLPISENPHGIDHFPHLVFVQNRGRREDYALLSMKQKCRFIENTFSKSALLLKDGVSLKNSSYDIYDQLGDDYGLVNLFVLPDMKPRGYKPESLTSYKGVPDFEILVRDLRKSIMALSKPSFGPNVQTEKNWFHMAARTWDMTRKSLLISDYGHMLP